MKGRMMVGLVVAVMLVGGCANDDRDASGGGGGEQRAATTTPVDRQAGTQAAGPGDRAFIDGMVPHHEMGVMMAEDALDKAHSPEVKAFARKMATDQRKEIAELKRHRQTWFGSAQTPPMDHGDMTHPKAGSDFDVRWSQQMAQHHQQGIDMAKRALAEAKTPEARTMAQQIIDKQSKEKAQLNRWINAWKSK